MNKRQVFAIATSITSPMGLTSAEHWKAVASGKSGVQEHVDASLSNAPFWASKIGTDQWQRIQSRTAGNTSLTAFEQLSVYSVQNALELLGYDLPPGDTILILSTTKGNIELLGRVPDERISLNRSANTIASVTGFDANKPLVVSHACVSGVLALTYAQRLLESGKYKNAVVVGCDRFSKFVLNGFQSFQAIADESCKPFDANRKGINLGEAAATIILTSEPGQEPLARLYAGATSNDANHISGPSRTGEELAIAINRSLQEAGISAEQVDMVSAHGTATAYNDEMESKAFNLCGLANTPVHSFKGYTGHTLGAAGVLESAMIIQSLQQQQLIPSAGFETLGVQPLNVTTQMEQREINFVLKTASGFGGCNATAVWGK